jgi:hypothetical protein
MPFCSLNSHCSSFVSRPSELYHNIYLPPFCWNPRWFQTIRYLRYCPEQILKCSDNVVEITLLVLSCLSAPLHLLDFSYCVTFFISSHRSCAISLMNFFQYPSFRSFILWLTLFLTSFYFLMCCKISCMDLTFLYFR